MAGSFALMKDEVSQKGGLFELHESRPDGTSWTVGYSVKSRKVGSLSFSLYMACHDLCRNTLEKRSRLKIKRKMAMTTFIGTSPDVYR